MLKNSILLELIHKSNKTDIKSEDKRENIKAYGAISYSIEQSEKELRRKAKFLYGLGVTAFTLAGSVYAYGNIYESPSCETVHCVPTTPYYSLATGALACGAGCFLFGAGATLDTVAACLEHISPHKPTVKKEEKNPNNEEPTAGKEANEPEQIKAAHETKQE